MQTNVTLTEEKPQEIVPEVGQFWRHKDGHLYQIMKRHSESYGLVCVYAPSPSSYQGETYSYDESQTVEGVFSSHRTSFTFVPNVSITI